MTVHGEVQRPLDLALLAREYPGAREIALLERWDFGLIERAVMVSVPFGDEVGGLIGVGKRRGGNRGQDDTESE